MGFVLRLVLAACVMWLAANVVYYPAEAKAYVSPRYQAFYEAYLNKCLPSGYLSAKLFLNLSPMVFQACGVFLAIYSILLALGQKCLITIVGVITMVVGILLHLPCVAEPRIDYYAQLRKLLLLLAFFSASMAIPCNSCCASNKPQEPAQEFKRKHS